MRRGFRSRRVRELGLIEDAISADGSGKWSDTAAQRSARQLLEELGEPLEMAANRFISDSGDPSDDLKREYNFGQQTVSFAN